MKKSIASLLMRARHLKKYGNPRAVERQIAKIVDHPDFETICLLLDNLQKLNYITKAEEEIEIEVDEILPEEELTEKDVLDLDLDVCLDSDEDDKEEADVAGDVLLIDDLVEDSNPYSQDESHRPLVNREEAEDEDFEIILDLDFDSELSDEDVSVDEPKEEKLEEKPSEDEVKEETKQEVSHAKKSVSKKIKVTKAQIAAKKRALLKSSK